MPSKKKKLNIKFFAVTCTELHNAIGPIAGEAIAVKVARMMTDSSGGCVYVPVPLNFTGVVVAEDEVEALQKAKKPDTETIGEGGHFGQYL